MKKYINIYDSFCLIDIMRKCPYSTELLNEETINEAADDLEKVFY